MRRLTTMKAKAITGGVTAGIVGAALMLVLPAEAHHSFAMYDMSKTVVVTGVVQRVDPAPNHQQIFFAVMNEDRTNVVRDEKGAPIIWTVEMAGSAAMARQGVTVNSFAPRTVFSVALHPLRNGEPGGSRDGAMFRCPDEMPPEPGMHCDSVEGRVAIGEGSLPTPSE
jgi:hypothetical protein